VVVDGLMLLSIVHRAVKRLLAAHSAVLGCENLEVNSGGIGTSTSRLEKSRRFASGSKSNHKDSRFRRKRAGSSDVPQDVGLSSDPLSYSSSEFLTFGVGMHTNDNFETVVGDGFLAHFLTVQTTVSLGARTFAAAIKLMFTSSTLFYCL